jgi:AcrR family transcriptional regulator
MPRGKKESTAEIAEIAEIADLGDELPAWKRQSVERSLKTARARAQERTDRFVTATIELMGETGSTDFTVQDVVDRSRMSIRTFYNFFASKDDLLAAVHATIIANEVAPRLRKLCQRQSDPILRIRAYIEGLYTLTAGGGPVSRVLTTYYNRLAETRPSELDLAFQPQIDLVVELVRDAIKAKRLHPTLGPEKLAYLLHHTVLAIVHTHVLGADLRTEVTAEDLWLFCAHGLGVQTGVAKRR